MGKQTLEKLTKAELYERAQKVGVAGRSEMGKQELIAALSVGVRATHPMDRGPRAGPLDRAPTLPRGAVAHPEPNPHPPALVPSGVEPSPSA